MYNFEHAIRNTQSAALAVLLENKNYDLPCYDALSELEFSPLNDIKSILYDEFTITINSSGEDPSCLFELNMLDNNNQYFCHIVGTSNARVWQLYYCYDDEQIFCEENSIFFDPTKCDNVIKGALFTLPKGINKKLIRIDTGNKPGECCIEKFVVYEISTPSGNHIEKCLAQKNEIYSCSRLGRQLIVDHHAALPCCGVGALPWQVPLFSAKKLNSSKDALASFIQRVNEIKLANQSSNPPCMGCEYFGLVNNDHKIPKISVIALSTSLNCNLRCKYCFLVDSYFDLPNKNKMWHSYPLDFIKECFENDLFSENLYIELSGGEPILNQNYRRIMDFILENKINSLTISNGVFYSDILYEAMKQKVCALRCSLDSGNRKIYNVMKGKDHFFKVLHNLYKYSESGGTIYLKYLITNLNDDFSSIEDFVYIARELKTAKIIIETEQFGVATSSLMYNKNSILTAIEYMEEFATQLNVPIYSSLSAFALEKLKRD